MSDLFKYKDYYGTIEYSEKDDCLFGKIIGISSLYLYEGNTIKELKKDFEKAVDSYLSFCKENSIEPEKAYKGSFNVRVSPEVHKQAALLSIKKGITLNSLVEASLKSFIDSQNYNYSGMCASDNKNEYSYKQKKKKDYQS